ncbi:MAG: glutathione S-transferase family protein [Kangiellaceae bacterium]|jgi:glutathione S-transferase|nr:glutathione S-transferase family protein [Kangiellaceae bacterium]
MKLFYSTASPYARTCQVTLREVGLVAQQIEQATHPFDNEPEFLASNPLGKVPCLLVDGQAIFDSEIICQYLDRTYNNSALFNTINNDWQLTTSFSLISGLLDLAVARRQEVMRDQEGIKSEFWWSRFNDGIERGLSELNQRVSLFPAELSQLDINCICLMDYLSFRHPDINWRHHSMLQQHYQTYSSRESLINTKPSD